MPRRIREKIKNIFANGWKKGVIGLFFITPWEPALIWVGLEVYYHFNPPR